MKKLKKENKGFSLVELIVVVLILGILAVAVTPQIMNWVDKSKKNTDETTVESIEVAAQAAVLEYMETNAVAAEVYYVDGGTTPSITQSGSANTGLGAKILTAIGAVSDPKQDPTKVYKIEVTATSGQVKVSLSAAPTP